jgi:glucose/arabinose dehydrogenase/PKD repeat protein
MGLGAVLVGGGCSDSREPDAEGSLGRTQAAVAIGTTGFNETTAFSGLKQPTVVRFASDGRVFVAEKGGKIWIYDSLSDSTPSLFVDLSDRVQDLWDRGLLGMALDPAFPSKPDVYVLYAFDGDPGGAAGKWGDQCPTPPGANADGCVISGRLSRLTASGNIAGPETVLIEGWRQQYPSHSLGQLEFGTDGALYASAGDGASFDFVDYGQTGVPLNPLGDPPVAVGASQTPPNAQGGALRAQSPRRVGGPTLLNGTVIRVDPATGAGLPDNPGASSTDANQKRVIAYGLRNPFRFTPRPGKNELWIADVGWSKWEELNRLPLGGKTLQNFGWPCYEGAGKQAGYDGAGLALCKTLYASGGETPPVFTYAHTAGVSASDGCSRGTSAVTGLAFYTGGSYPPAYNGSLFFADYPRRCIYVMDQGPGGDPDPVTARSFHVAADDPVFLTTGPEGDLFYAALTSGKIQRISYRKPIASFSATPTQGQVPLIVSFDGSASKTADPAELLSYAWDLDGDGEFDDATEAKPGYLYDKIGSYSPRLKVTDPRGGFGFSAPLTIKVTAAGTPISTPPQAFIDTPASTLTWKVGDEIEFSGHAIDAEDGPLPASALSWQLVIQHCPSGCHIHDLLSYDGVASGSFTAEDHEYPMYLALILTATDSSGDRSSATLSLDPATVGLVFDTDPSGLELVVGATPQVTPFARRVIVGSMNTVSAAASQMAAGSSWGFSAWSDGLPRAHTLAAAATASRYVASYVAAGLTGQYFNQLAFGGAAEVTRIDPVIDFDWGVGAPAPGVDGDTFSVRWSGEIKADFAENYTFSTTSDDGVRLRIDSATVIDHFNNHQVAVDTGTLTLSPGWHPIQLEYFENTGSAQVELAWSSVSQPAEIVPASHLRPTCASGACSGGLTCNASDQCVPACDSTHCGGGEHCGLSGAGCVGSCTGLSCPSGDVCVAGACVDACSVVTCPAQQLCMGGACIDEPLPGGGGAGGTKGGGAGQDGGGGAGGAKGGGGDQDGGGGAGRDSGAAGAVIAAGGGTPSSDGGSRGGYGGDYPSTEGGAAPNVAGSSATPGEDGGSSPETEGTSGVAGTEPDSQPRDAGAGAGSGAKGSENQGGASGEPSSPPAEQGGTPSSPSPSRAAQDEGGCSCRAAGSGARGVNRVALLGLGLSVCARRRRRRTAARRRPAQISERSLCGSPR